MNIYLYWSDIWCVLHTTHPTITSSHRTTCTHGKPETVLCDPPTLSFPRVLLASFIAFLSILWLCGPCFSCFILVFSCFFLFLLFLKNACF